MCLAAADLVDWEQHTPECKVAEVMHASVQNLHLTLLVVGVLSGC